MFDQYEHEHQIVDGVFSFDNKSYKKVSHNYLGEYSIEEIKSFSDLYNDETIPVWLLRHGIGVPHDEEDTTSFIRTPKSEYNYSQERKSELLYSINYNSLKNIMIIEFNFH